jgi:hypothetical protein
MPNAGSGRGHDGALGGHPGSDAATGGAAPAPGGPTDDPRPHGFFDAFITTVADRVGPTVQPAAVAAIASTFGFPLVLMLAVLLFLVVQSRLDGGDPKLQAAPMTTADTYVPFLDGDPS